MGKKKSTVIMTDEEKAIYSRDHAMFPLYILDVMKELETDEERRYNNDEIEYIVQKKYGIKLERKARDKYIRWLKEIGRLASSPGKNGVYYCPDSAFSEDELRLLLYSVACNPTITQEDVQNLSAKIKEERPAALNSVYFLRSGRRRGDCADVMENIRRVEKAILNRQPIWFSMLRYNLLKKLEPRENIRLYPTGIMMMKQHFVVVGFDDELNAEAAYPLDFVTDIKPAGKAQDKRMMELLSKPVEIANDWDYSWCLDEYSLPWVRKHAQRKRDTVRFNVKQTLLDEILDVFGMDTMVFTNARDSFQEQNEHLADIDVKVEGDLKEIEKWILAHAEETKVLDPPDFRDRIRDKLLEAAFKYCNE